MPVFIMLVVDGNGISEVICIWFIKSESLIAADQVHGKIKVVIADKDLAD